MTAQTDTTEIRAVLDAVRKGHRDKDAAAIGAQYAEDAVIFDLSPPLAHTPDVSGIAAWLDTWEGPVDLQANDLTVEISGDLAFCHGLSKTSATTKPDGQRAQWWQRLTVCLRRTDGGWKIVHEHTSVPFYMDGSYRAAVDLEP